MKSPQFDIRVYEERCTGCRACELACSFHHCRLFSRQVASVEVNRSEKTWEMSIIRYLKDEAGHTACDYCRGEAEPLCAKYCVPRAIVGE